MDTRILIAGGTIAGLVGGAAAGYIYAVKKLTREYDEVFNEVLEEQLQKERRHYQDRIEELKNNADELHHNIERLREGKRVAQTPIGVEAGDALIEGPDVEVLERVVEGLKRKDDPNALKYHVAAGTPNADRGAHIMGQSKPDMGEIFKARSEPLMITEESYMLNEPEYYQIELTYFVGDGILIDAEENLIEEVNILLGETNVKQFPHIQDDVVYVCNHKRNSYFEVTLDKRTYEEVVAGLADGP